ncbi:MAG: hypothetical protein ACI8X5_000187 [Planctomycetota bacterium]|jgi:hypothetical protein
MRIGNLLTEIQIGEGGDINDVLEGNRGGINRTFRAGAFLLALTDRALLLKGTLSYTVRARHLSWGGNLLGSEESEDEKYEQGNS